MKLVVAEKPSVGRDLARVLGARDRGDGSMSGNGWVVTWCIGHLVELEEPQAYDSAWKRWSFATLPMVPDTFRLRPAKRTTSQWRIVRDLLRDRTFDFVINACDAGREGELIFRYVYERSGCRLRVQRLWISSLTSEAIEKGFERLRPGHAFDGLAAAARARALWSVSAPAAWGSAATAPASRLGRLTSGACWLGPGLDHPEARYHVGACQLCGRHCLGLGSRVWRQVQISMLQA